MFSRVLLCAVFFVVLLINHEPCAAKTNHLCEHPSSCGHLTNISYPFRLQGDPENCGDPSYQLTCENNRAILSLYSGKYYVKEINYKYSTIRIADVGLQEDNCSTLPLYHLSENNFTKTYFYVARILCSPLYISALILSSKKAYRYVVSGDMKASEVGDSCPVDLVVMATPLDNKRSLSYIDIHKILVNGLTLEWDTIYCRECKAQGFCLLDNTTRLCLAIRLVCGAPCVFIFLIYKWRRRHLSTYDNIEDFLQSHHNFMPIRYSYPEIKKMTSYFKEKLGEGGYC
ncbi:hypothetical protein POPTR_012G003301v4 [Populus trichocarpa]|uniref:Uncharacterized protein n=1 Tax=Populus trichocarpa TaxID=3694 RepID=A0ACC0S5B8_POPTR|nr:hypothetical protein POPTR_012G003301v4 [Populus trichocarpa]